ncbi:MAG: hypothetical protein M3144_07540, partial [Actinomycetota bacterium]|nr:hypothetical protein [Actinomycetota bacterium]
MNGPGPLVVSSRNRRYFALAPADARDGKAIYLTGSHIWNNLHDGLGPGAECGEDPEVFDFQAYLGFLKEHGHNFIRLWRWEQFRSQTYGGVAHLCMSPQPWARTGPGNAKDGRPKFDLDTHDDAFFDRLRDRVAGAGREGIYVAVMFFEGWALHLSPPPDSVEGHPFHADANINGIGIASLVDYQVLPLDPRVQGLQEAYLRRVVDTVHDQPNVLWEVANESSGHTADSVDLGGGFTVPTPIGDSTEWQYWVMDFVRGYEKEKGYDSRPFGMTYQFPSPDQRKANDPLHNSSAEWISPGFDEPITIDPQSGPTPGRYYTDPPPNDGAKIIIADTDHFAPGRGDAIWPWKAFLRGQHPILMDFGLFGGVNPPTASPEYDAFEPSRWAMGDTLRYAERMNLIEMEPRGDLTSTTYALAQPGEEYLVLQPASASFEVALEPGTYASEWYSVETRESSDAGSVEVESSVDESFTPPFQGAGVLYLRR